MLSTPARVRRWARAGELCPASPNTMSRRSARTPYSLPDKRDENPHPPGNARSRSSRTLGRDENCPCYRLPYACLIR